MQIPFLAPDRGRAARTSGSVDHFQKSQKNRRIRRNPRGLVMVQVSTGCAETITVETIVRVADGYDALEQSDLLSEEDHPVVTVQRES